MEGKSKKKVYNKQERDLRKQIKDKVDVLETELEGEVTPERAIEINLELKQLQAEGEKLGRNFVWSKFGRGVLNYVHLKSQGWNVFSSTSEVTFCFMSNLTHANGREDFTLKEFWRANGIMLNSTMKNASFDQAQTPTAKKVANLMQKFEVLGDFLDTNGEDYNKDIKKGIKKLMPFEIQKQADYYSKGTTFVSMMLHKKIKDKNGNEKSLWEAYDTEGNWKTEEFGADP